MEIMSEDSRYLLGQIAESRPFHIILADDDADDFDFFKEAMQSIVPGLDISRAYDGADLIRILESAPGSLPDLIFLDLNMPCRNGFESLAVIRKNEKWINIPVIIYSTSAFPDQIDNTYKLGANLYIQKPDDYNEIRQIVKKIFSINFDDLICRPAKEDYFVTLK